MLVILFLINHTICVETMLDIKWFGTTNQMHRYALSVVRITHKSLIYIPLIHPLVA
jgi:hypothetical protein